MATHYKFHYDTCTVSFCFIPYNVHNLLSPAISCFYRLPCRSRSRSLLYYVLLHTARTVEICTRYCIYESSYRITCGSMLYVLSLPHLCTTTTPSFCRTPLLSAFHSTRALLRVKAHTRDSEKNGSLLCAHNVPLWCELKPVRPNIFHRPALLSLQLCSWSDLAHTFCSNPRPSAFHKKKRKRSKSTLTFSSTSTCRQIQPYRCNRRVESVLFIVQARDDNTISLKIRVQGCAWRCLDVGLIVAAGDQVVIAIPRGSVEALQVATVPRWKKAGGGSQESKQAFPKHRHRNNLLARFVHVVQAEKSRKDNHFNEDGSTCQTNKDLLSFRSRQFVPVTIHPWANEQNVTHQGSSEKTAYVTKCIQ
jgi:hypothetical protein